MNTAFISLASRFVPVCDKKLWDGALENWFPKKFAPEREQTYILRIHRRAVPLGRVAAVVGLLYFIAFAYWDTMLDPDALEKTLKYRVWSVSHFALAIALTYTPIVRDSPLLWPYFLFCAYLAVAVPFPMIMGQLPDGFILGTSGFIFGMLFLALVVNGAKQAIAVMMPYTGVVLLVMYYAGATQFELLNTVLWVGGGVAFSVTIAHVFDVLSRRAYLLECELEEERERSEALLLNILPVEIAERLKAEEEPLADRLENASVLFADLVGFTDAARNMSADELVTLLNDLFSRFDALADKFDAEKIKTIGDAYMVSTGLLGDKEHHAERIADLSLAMQQAFHEFCEAAQKDMQIRIGIHSGPVVAGVIGKRKFSYDLWGNTVNLASRMESDGVPGKIQLTRDTRELLPERFQIIERGKISVKGHRDRTTFFLEGAGPA